VGEFSLTVDLRHLQAADPELADELVQKPSEYLSLVRDGCDQ
jgi:DNA replicative helicase MCM subunit Mcm2 (Cdc46/Mcm family)